MITILNDVPSNLAAFKASGEVSKEDFENTVIPHVEKLLAQTGKINYMLVLETSIKNFTFGAWMEDALLGIKHLLKWNRAAIVTDSEGIKAFTTFFSAMVPGEFKGFDPTEYHQAVKWASTEF